MIVLLEFPWPQTTATGRFFSIPICSTLSSAMTSEPAMLKNRSSGSRSMRPLAKRCASRMSSTWISPLSSIVRRSSSGVISDTLAGFIVRLTASGKMVL